MLPIDLPIEPVPRPVEISLSYETLRLPPVDLPTGESIGTLGVSYRQHVAPNWVAGLGFYGAVSGRRGGFLAWGVTGAYQQTWGPWQGEAGLFVGGGGGGPAWTGSGLMLRPHAEISRFWGDVGVGFGVSQVRFPDGKDGGSHVYGALKWRTDGFFGPAGGGNIDFSDALAPQAMPAEYAAMAGSYRMRGGPPSKEGAGSGGAMHFAGFVYRRALTGQWLGAEPYALLSLAGSAGVAGKTFIHSRSEIHEAQEKIEEAKDKYTELREKRNAEGDRVAEAEDKHMLSIIRERFSIPEPAAGQEDEAPVDEKAAPAGGEAKPAGEKPAEPAPAGGEAKPAAGEKPATH